MSTIIVIMAGILIGTEAGMARVIIVGIVHGHIEAGTVLGITVVGTVHGIVVAGMAQAGAGEAVITMVAVAIMAVVRVVIIPIVDIAPEVDIVLMEHMIQGGEVESPDLEILTDTQQQNLPDQDVQQWVVAQLMKIHTEQHPVHGAE